MPQGNRSHHDQSCRIHNKASAVAAQYSLLPDDQFDHSCSTSPLAPQEDQNNEGHAASQRTTLSRDHNRISTSSN